MCGLHMGHISNKLAKTFQKLENIASSVKVFCRIYNVPEVRKSNANIGLSGRRNLTHKCDLIKRSGAES